MFNNAFSEELIKHCKTWAVVSSSVLKFDQNSNSEKYKLIK